MKARTESPLTLEAVAEHFEQWRSHKKKGERIPEHLWREATNLLDTYPISQVTRTLRLSGSDVNKRRGITHATRRQKGMAAKATQPGTAFVEVDPNEVARTSALSTRHTWLELHRPDGLRLRIHPGDGGELLALVDRFMGA